MYYRYFTSNTKSILVEICANYRYVRVKTPQSHQRVVIMGSFCAHPCLYSTKPNIFRTRNIMRGELTLV